VRARRSAAAVARSGEIVLSVAKTSRADARAAPVSRRGAMMTPRRAGEAPPTSLRDGRFGVLQRKCACGGTCPRCRGEAHIQPKLAIGEPGDAFEQEADRVADQVMRMPDPLVNASSAPPRVQRKYAACEEEKKTKLHAKRDHSRASAATATAPSIVHEVLRSPGQPLDEATRAFMEPRFGRDFGSVRVHADAKAGRAAQMLQARAFTVQNNIAFASCQYAPESHATHWLLAHELAHVMQQSSDGDLHAGPIGVGFRTVTVQRQSDPAAPPPAPEPAAPAATPGPTLMMAKPPHFAQNALTCWASAIASWQRVKGLVASNVTDATLIAHYKRTACTDEQGALAGDSDADIEAVFAEWRLLLKLSAEVAEESFTFDFIKSLIEKHGHFVLVTGEKSLMHAMVVYGVESTDKSDPMEFSVFVVDPLRRKDENKVHRMVVERPIRVALGTEKSAGPAPCRSKPPD